MEKQIKLSPPQEKSVLISEGYTQDQVNDLEKRAVLALKREKNWLNMGHSGVSTLLKTEFILPELEKAYIEALKRLINKEDLNDFLWNAIVSDFTIRSNKIWLPKARRRSDKIRLPKARASFYQEISKMIEEPLLKRYTREDFFDFARMYYYVGTSFFNQSKLLMKTQEKVNAFFKSDLKEKVKTYSDIPYYCDPYSKGDYSYEHSWRMLYEENKELQKMLMKKYYEHLSKKIDFEM